MKLPIKVYYNVAECKYHKLRPQRSHHNSLLYRYKYNNRFAPLKDQCFTEAGSCYIRCIMIRRLLQVARRCHVVGPTCTIHCTCRLILYVELRRLVVQGVQESSDQVMSWLCKESSDQVMSWLCKESSDQVMSWLCKESSDQVMSWLCKESSDQVMSWLCKESSDQVMSWLCKESSDQVMSWLCKESSDQVMSWLCKESSDQVMSWLCKESSDQVMSWLCK